MFDPTPCSNDAITAPKKTRAGKPSESITAPPHNASKKRRHRSQHACLSCRTRKVRCDVTTRVPCGNCMHDSVECVLVGRRDKRRFTISKKLIADERPVSSVRRNPSPEIVDSPAFNLRPCELSTTEQYLQPNLNGGSEGGGDECPRPESTIDPFYLSAMAPCDLFPSCEAIIPLSPTPTSCSTLWTLTQDEAHAYGPTPLPVQAPCIASSLPDFIEPLGATHSEGDTAHLLSEGALTIPSSELRIALLQAFLDYVYPDFPVIDFEWLISVFNGHEGTSRRINILLFQAIMFAASAHVKLEYLRSNGYQSRRHARIELFNRARLLYDFDCKRNHLALVQSLLLMSSRHDDDPERYENLRHWVDTAIAEAITAGFHIDATVRSSRLSHKDQKLRRRLWWACYITDRLFSLAVVEPPKIRDNSFTVRMLTEADFAAYAVSEEDSSNGSHANRLSAMDAGTHERVASLFVAKARLCQCLKFHCSPSRLAFDDAMSSSSHSEALTSEICALVSTSQCLGHWQRSLPDNCKYLPGLATGTGRRAESQSAIFLSCAVLSMLSNTISVVLHRRWLTTTRRAPCSWPLEDDTLRRRQLDAARRISDVAGDIHARGLTTFVPTTAALAAVTSSAVVHVQELNSKTKANKDDALEGYRRCMRVLRSMQGASKAAEVARTALNHALVESLNVVRTLRSGDGHPPPASSLVPEHQALSSPKHDSTTVLTPLSFELDCALTSKDLVFADDARAHPGDMQVGLEGLGDSFTEQPLEYPVT